MQEENKIIENPPPMNDGVPIPECMKNAHEKEYLDIKVEQETCVPPKVFKRNDYGLICDGSIKYVYGEDGTIDWRRMVKPDFLVPNKSLFEKMGKAVPNSIEGLQDRELLILLGGIKELAAIRGFVSCTYDVVAPTNEYVIATCKIEWVPNYETQGLPVVSSGIGDASPKNTTSFGKFFLGPFAENRAFVRCVRQFLRINVVSQEEVVGMVEEATESPATNLLKETATKYGLSFEQIKAKLIFEKMEGAEKLQSFKDIPKVKQFELVERIKRKAAEKFSD